MRDITERQELQVLSLGLSTIARGMGWSKEAALKMEKNAGWAAKRNVYKMFRSEPRSTSRQLRID